MKLIRSVREMQEASSAVKRAGRRVALVPTMGALHQGHIALMRKAREQGAAVVVSVYVNPTQLGPQDCQAAPEPRRLHAQWRAEGVHFSHSRVKGKGTPSHGHNAVFSPERHSFETLKALVSGLAGFASKLTHFETRPSMENAQQ